MDESAPITWLINQINLIVNNGSSTVASAVAGVVAPVAAACFGIYMILILWGYWRGASTDPVLDFLTRMASWAVIIGLGLNASNYNAAIAPMVTGLGGDLANAVSGGTVTAGTLDQLALLYLNIIGDGFTAAQAVGGLSGIGVTILVALKAIIIIIGLVPFLVAATLSIIVANVGSQIIAMVGPFFFACLLFPPTRQYFSAWVNSALSYALIPFIIAVIASISVGISAQMMPIASGSTLADATFQSVFLAAIGNLLLLFLLRYVSALASSLSAGGINIGSIGGVGAFASGARNSAAGSFREAKGAVAFGRGAGRVGAALQARMANRNNSIRKVG